MKVLICGSRSISDPTLVSQAISQSGTNPTHIISGGARGVDMLARVYAASNGIEFTEYVADWDRYGKRAGFMRNLCDGRNGRTVIAIWNGMSPGRKHTSDYATSRGERGLCIQSFEKNGADDRDRKPRRRPKLKNSK